MNVFEWIRGGIKEAVLLGVSDAVDTIGTPASGEDLSQHLQAAIADGSSSGGTRVAGRTKRKKLGRSLGEIQAIGKKAS